MREKLLAEMQKEKWAITFSVGVLTCIKPPKTVDEVIKIVDGLMYEVKNNGKNSVRFEEHFDDSPTANYQEITKFAEAGSFQ